DPASPPYGPDTADYADWMKGFDAGTTLIAAVSEPRPTAEIIPAEDEDEPPAAPASDSFDDSMEDEPDAAEVRVARQDWKDSTRSHIRDFDETARTLEAKFDNEAPAFLDRN
ncbi:MAG: hypothetical protein KGL35_26400, partial [Bradyrhizobium sp.]|nr:hypothetical protein [Bradyrhizobium sp.]